MIFKSALIAAAAFALVAVLTGKDVVRRHAVVLAGMRYEITRYTMACNSRSICGAVARRFRLGPTARCKTRSA